MLSALGAVIHFSNDYEINTVCALKHMKSIVDTITRCSNLENEHWNLEFDDNLPGLTKTYWGSKREWEESPGWMDFHKRRLFRCNINFQCAETRKINIFQARFLTKSEYHKLPYGYSEKDIVILINNTLCKYVNEIEFKSVVKQASIELGASYACIDHIVPEIGVYNEPFFRYAHIMDEWHDETFLYGIHWAGLISQTALKNTGSIEEIVKSIPCETAEIIEGGNELRLWYEITTDKKKASYKKRLLLREYFSKSLPSISTEMIIKERRLKDWNNMPSSVRLREEKYLKEIPLSKEEIECIKNRS